MLRYLVLALMLIAAKDASAQAAIPILSAIQGQSGETEYSVTLQLLGLMTVLTLLPSILLMMTSFTRVIIVLSLLRQAMGTAQTPPNQILLGIALFLTIFIMAPVFTQVYDDAIAPYSNDEIGLEAAIEAAQIPMKDFMLRQARPKDVEFFMGLAKMKPTKVEDLPMSVVIPGFILSELRTGFQMGFLLFIPFILIDFVVAIVLMSLGLLFLPPVTISMPLKILLFVLVDGWTLVVRSLALSFGT